MPHLTPVTAEHLAEIQRHAAHPDIASTSNVPSPYPANGAETWFRNLQLRREEGSAEAFAIFDEGQLAGVVSLIDIDAAKGSATVGYWTAVPFQGKGFATVALALVVDHAFNTLHLSTLHGLCLAANPASAQVMLNNGFRERAPSVTKGGRFNGQATRRFSLG